MPTPLNIELNRVIGANLKRLRTARGLSQARLAARLGVTFQQLQKYENGRDRISAVSLAVLAAALECRFEEFFQAA